MVVPWRFAMGLFHSDNRSSIFMGGLDIVEEVSCTYIS
jgi:hypothetical protein